jgi:(p)ppGpp synthase/HD superfamily hydrolase
MWDQDLFRAALNFAAKAHAEQRDPGNNFPYVTHCTKVAMETLHACVADRSLDANLAVCCALLHDTVEDCGITLADIESAFGSRVAAGVSALTKNGALPKPEAMRDSLDRIRQQGREVWCVKLADRITNLEIAPPYWTPEKRVWYRDEAKIILEKLREGSAHLAKRLEDKIAGYA